MSFHVEFHAIPAHVEKTMRLHPCPQSVYDFIMTAVENLNARSVDDDKMAIIEIYATGHLCDSTESYEVSNAEIKVRRLLIAK